MSDQVPCEWPRQPQYFGAQPSDRDSGRVGKNKVCDCGGLELAQNPWAALVVVFAQPRGNKAQHCFSQFLFGLVLSVGSLLDLPVYFSALGNSYANWLFGYPGLWERVTSAVPIRFGFPARVLASLCWRNLKVVLWRSPTACEIRWKSGRGQTLPVGLWDVYKAGLLDMNLMLCRTAAAVARTTQKLSVILTNLKLGGTTW